MNTNSVITSRLFDVTVEVETYRIEINNGILVKTYIHKIKTRVRALNYGEAMQKAITEKYRIDALRETAISEHLAFFKLLIHEKPNVYVTKFHAITAKEYR